MEIWKDIKEYEGFYQVSNFGNVRSLDRVLKCGRHLKGKNIKPCVGPSGFYPQVSLTKDGKCTTKTVHRLVAQAFIPNPNNLPCINHKDENKGNNKAENLEWCTYQYNNMYSDITYIASESRRGKSLSAEHKKSLSIALKKSGKERAQKRMNTIKEKYPQGLKQSEESNLKRSLALKGKPKSEQTKQKMRKPKSPQAIENMRRAQVLAWERRKIKGDK